MKLKEDALIEGLSAFIEASKYIICIMQVWEKWDLLQLVSGWCYMFDSIIDHEDRDSQ